MYLFYVFLITVEAPRINRRLGLGRIFHFRLEMDSSVRLLHWQRPRFQSRWLGNRSLLFHPLLYIRHVDCWFSFIYLDANPCYLRKKKKDFIWSVNFLVFLGWRNNSFFFDNEITVEDYFWTHNLIYIEISC